MEQNSSGIGYFLLGLGVGVAAGILWAPRAGDETRQLIADKANEGADYVRARAEDGRQYVRARAEEGADYVRQQTDQLKGSANEIYERGRSTVIRQKENLNAAVEAGKQAYRDAVTDFKAAAAGQTSTSGSGSETV